MISRTLFVVFLFTLASGVARSQDPNDAGSYLSFIGTQYHELSKDMMSYTSAAAHSKSARKIEKRRTELLQQIKQSERNVRQLKPFQKDIRLRDSVAAYFKLCFHVLTEDYGKILNMEDIAEQSYDLMEAYMLAKEKAKQKLDEAGDRVDKEYTDFAANNNVRLIGSESKLQQKVKTASRVNAYYNQVYLIFFRNHINETYFMDGLAKRDVNSMEQTLSTLKTTSAEGIEKLRTIPPFEGDGSLKTVCLQVLAFYQKEAVTHFPIYVEFELRKENFEKMKKALDAKRPADRTQSETDAFSNAVKEYNTWVNKVNATNNECNKNRSTLINAWNDRGNAFLDNHTPTY